MSLLTVVHVSGIVSLAEARYCAGMGVELLGFCLDPHHPAYVDPARFREIRGWLAGVLVVGETSQTHPAQIQSLLDTYQPDYLQLDDVSLLPAPGTLGIPLVLRVNLANDEPGTLPDRLRALARAPLSAQDYLLLDGLPPQPDAALMATLRDLVAQHKLLLRATTPAETRFWLDNLPGSGIALAGSLQTDPDSGGFDALMDVLEGLEAEG